MVELQRDGPADPEPGAQHDGEKTGGIGLAVADHRIVGQGGDFHVRQGQFFSGISVLPHYRSSQRQGPCARSACDDAPDDRYHRDRADHPDHQLSPAAHLFPVQPNPSTFVQPNLFVQPKPVPRSASAITLPHILRRQLAELIF